MKSLGAPHLAEIWGHHRIVRRFILPCALLVALPAFAAQPKTAAPAMPTKPLALLRLGAQRNGLIAPGLRPWHIEVAYQTYKFNGRRKATGIFQEWWAAPNRYHLSFDRKGYRLQAWVTPHGSFAIGNPDLPMPERLLYHWIVAPIPQHPDLAGARLRYRVRLIGPVQLPCVQIHSRPSAPGNLPPQYPTYCFESRRPILRSIDTHVSESVTFNTVGELRRQYLAQRLTASVGSTLILTALLQQGQSYARMAPAFLAPPANARPAPPPSTALLYLNAAETATHLILARLPRGQNWKLLHESQVHVELAASIGIRGRIESLHIIVPTDPELNSAIYQSVSQFRYRPFLRNGVPAAVRTHIILDFRKALPH